MEQKIIHELNLIDPNQHELIWDIIEAISKFNRYEDESLSVKADNEYLALYLDGKQLSSAEDFEILKRVKQINHERGLDDFE